MTHAIRPDAHPHPDPGRIAGFSAAIALNAALLLLLLTPMKIPPVAPLHEVIPVLRLVDRTPVEPPPPLPPVRNPDPKPVAATTRPETLRPQPPAPVLAPQGSEAAPETPPATTADASPDIAPPAAPVPGVRLEYLQAPPPAYPRAALRARSHGTVLLRVLVGVDGVPLRVEVQDSSGDRRLDAAARDQVLLRWRFRPAMRDGRAVQALGLVPVAFNLAR